MEIRPTLTDREWASTAVVPGGTGRAGEHFAGRFVAGTAGVADEGDLPLAFFCQANESIRTQTDRVEARPGRDNETMGVRARRHHALTDLTSKHWLEPVRVPPGGSRPASVGERLLCVRCCGAAGCEAAAVDPEKREEDAPASRERESVFVTSRRADSVGARWLMSGGV